MNTVAIIGAGLCGATAAAKLVQAGFEVTVFDKGRSAGGRMSSKRTGSGYLDMGAQYFTARSADFQHQVQLWLEAGCAQEWSCSTASLASDGVSASLQASPDQQTRFIGVPSQQSPVKFLLADIPLRTGCRIEKLHRVETEWTLTSDNGEQYSGFDHIVLTMPPVQTEHLLAQSGLSELFVAPTSVLEPCWAVAVQAEGAVPGHAIFCEHPRLRFISHQESKPGRKSCYVLHFNATFSQDNLEQAAEFWFNEARDILSNDLGLEGAVEDVVAHRWLYASQNDEWTPSGLVSLPEHNIWIGGDWSLGGTVENAYLSGLNLATAVIGNNSAIAASE
ncbi:MAG: NAD(P)-binding protein [Halioglobus sp.]|nr:NAD(P)-binding protein [Halioglobus sp.]